MAAARGGRLSLLSSRRGRRFRNFCAELILGKVNVFVRNVEFFFDVLILFLLAIRIL